MFWEYNQISSQISTLLAKENVTLIDLLEQDDIVQECDADNKKLIEFLTRPNVVSELLALILEEPPDDDDLLLKYKHSARASQVIDSGIKLLNQAIVNNPAYLEKLYVFLKPNPPLNPLLASFFAKAVQVLLSQKSLDWYTYQVICLQVIDFFKNFCADFVARLVEHIGTSAIMNCVQCISEVSVDGMEPNVSAWLDQQEIVEKLISVICCRHSYAVESSVAECEVKVEALNLNSDSNAPDVNANNENSDGDKVDSESPKRGEAVAINEELKRKLVENATSLDRIISGSSANAAQLLSYFISNGRKNDTYNKRNDNVLYLKCVSEHTIKLLLDSMFKAPENYKKHAIANGIQVLLTLIDSYNLDSVEYDHAVSLREEILKISEIILQWVPNFKDVLLNPPEQSTSTYNSFIEKPFGIARLHITKLFVLLIMTDSQRVCETIMDNDIFNIMLNLFFEYKWNSFLHFHMRNAIVEAFNASTQNKTYIAHLLKDCALTDRIMDAWNSNNDTSNGKNIQRCGYMGHLINIAFLMRTGPDFNYSELAGLKDLDLTAWEAFYKSNIEPIQALQETCPGGKPTSDSIGCEDILYKQQINTVEFASNMNLDDGDGFLNDLPDNAEQTFEAICENSTSSLGGADCWTAANIRNLMIGDDDDIEECSSSPKLAAFGRSLDTEDVLGLANKLSNCKNYLNDENWSNVNIRNLIEDDLADNDEETSKDDNSGGMGFTGRLTNRCANIDLLQYYFPWPEYNEAKPWEPTPSSQEQVGWANFSSFDGATGGDSGTSFPNEPFAEFSKLVGAVDKDTEFNDFSKEDIMWRSEEASDGSNIVKEILTTISSPDKPDSPPCEDNRQSTDVNQTENDKVKIDDSSDQKECVEVTIPVENDSTSAKENNECLEQECGISLINSEKSTVDPDSHR